MSTKIPTSLARELEKKGLTFKFVTKATGQVRRQTCEVRYRDDGRLLLSETGTNDLDALRKAVKACEGVARPLRDDEARRKMAEQEREIAALQAKLATASAPAPEAVTEPVFEPVSIDEPKRGRRPKPDENCTTC
jgi:hypothetical protein